MDSNLGFLILNLTFFLSSLWTLGWECLYPRCLEEEWGVGLFSDILGSPLAMKIYLAMTIGLFLLWSRVTSIPFDVQVNMCSLPTGSLETSLYLPAPSPLPNWRSDRWKIKWQMEDQISDIASFILTCSSSEGERRVLVSVWTSWAAGGWVCTGNLSYEKGKHWGFFPLSMW